MKNSKNTLELLALHMQSYEPVMFMNNPAIADFKKWTPLSNTTAPLLKNTLYVVSERVSEYESVFSGEGNFLVLNCKDIDFPRYIGPHTNILLIPEANSVSMIYSIMYSFFAGIDMWNKEKTEFLEGILDEKDIDYYISLLSEVLENPVILSDMDMNVISACDENLKNSSFIKMLRNDNRSNSCLLAGRSSYPSITKLDSYPFEAVTIIDNAGQHAYLLEVFGVHAPLKEDHLSFIGIFASFLSFIISKQNRIKVSDNWDSFIADIITRRVTGKNSIATKAKAFGEDSSKELWLICLKKQGAGYVLDDYANARHLLEKKTRCRVALYENFILVISPKNPADDENDELSSCLQQLCQQGWHYSVSAAAAGFSKLPKAFEQCDAALVLGLELDPQRSVFNYEDYLCTHFYSKALASVDPKEFILPIVPAMRQYDQENNTEYATTLYFYLYHYRNQETVAKMMHVHRNTITYRLEKIQDLFELDLNNHGLMDNILLSFNLMSCKSPRFWKI